MDYPQSHHLQCHPSIICHKCNIKFSCLCDLHKHKQEKHHDKNLIKCCKCGKGFKHQHHLARHFIIKHYD